MHYININNFRLNFTFNPSSFFFNIQFGLLSFNNRIRDVTENET